MKCLRKEKHSLLACAIWEEEEEFVWVKTSSCTTTPDFFTHIRFLLYNYKTSCKATYAILVSHNQLVFLIHEPNLHCVSTYTHGLVQNASERLTWMQTLLTRSKVKPVSPTASLPVFNGAAPFPQDLLVNYTWAFLFNMGWKHTWVPSIKRFLCCSLPVVHSNARSGGVCVCVCDIQKKAGIIH